MNQGRLSFVFQGDEFHRRQWEPSFKQIDMSHPKHLITLLSKTHASRELFSVKIPFIKKNVEHSQNERA